MPMTAFYSDKIRLAKLKLNTNMLEVHMLSQGAIMLAVGAISFTYRKKLHKIICARISVIRFL